MKPKIACIFASEDHWIVKWDDTHIVIMYFRALPYSEMNFTNICSSKKFCTNLMCDLSSEKRVT